MRKGRRVVRRIIGPAIVRLIKLFLLFLMTYLVQSCIMPYFAINGITPSLILCIIAIVTVALGKIKGIWAGAFFGIILETMQPTRPLLNLMLYPVCGMIDAVAFADKSVQKLEYERSVGKAGRNVTPLLRTPVCAFVNITIYEVVNIVYIYLRGSDITMINIGRGLLDIFLTTVLCLVIMLPVRVYLGIKRVKRASDAPIPYTTQ